jgi:hypothetical protein
MTSKIRRLANARSAAMKRASIGAIGLLECLSFEKTSRVDYSHSTSSRCGCCRSPGPAGSSEKDVLGLWIEQTEGAKFWLRVPSSRRSGNGRADRPTPCTRSSFSTGCGSRYATKGWSRIRRSTSRSPICGSKLPVRSRAAYSTGLWPKLRTDGRLRNGAAVVIRRFRAHRKPGFHTKLPCHPACRPRTAMPPGARPDAASSTRRAAVRPLGRTASKRRRSRR